MPKKIRCEFFESRAEFDFTQAPQFVRDRSVPTFDTQKVKGRVKIYRVPGPGPSTGGRRLFFRKNKGGKDFFSGKIRGAKTFFQANFSQNPV